MKLIATLVLMFTAFAVHATDKSFGRCQSLLYDHVREQAPHFLPLSLLPEMSHPYYGFTLMMRVAGGESLDAPLAGIELDPKSTVAPRHFMTAHDGAIFVLLAGDKFGLMAVAQEYARRVGAHNLSFQLIGEPAPYDWVYFPRPTATRALTQAMLAPGVPLKASEVWREPTTGKLLMAFVGRNIPTLASNGLLYLNESRGAREVIDSLGRGQSFAQTRPNGVVLSESAFANLQRLRPQELGARLSAHLPPVPTVQAYDLPTLRHIAVDRVDARSTWSIAAFLRHTGEATGIGHAQLPNELFQTWRALAPQVPPAATWRRIVGQFSWHHMVRAIENFDEPNGAKLKELWRALQSDVSRKLESDPPDFSAAAHEPVPTDALDILTTLELRYPNKMGDAQDLFEALWRDRRGTGAPYFNFAPNVVEDVSYPSHPAAEAAMVAAYARFLKSDPGAVKHTVRGPKPTAGPAVRASSGSAFLAAAASLPPVSPAAARVRDIVTNLAFRLNISPATLMVRDDAFETLAKRDVPRHRWDNGFKAGEFTAAVANPDSPSAQRLIRRWDEYRRMSDEPRRMIQYRLGKLGKVKSHWTTTIAVSLRNRYGRVPSAEAFRRLWHDTLPDLSADAFDDAIAKIGLRPDDLDRAREFPVPPDVHQRVQKSWSKFERHWRRTLEPLDAPKLMLPHPGDVTDARVLLVLLNRQLKGGNLDAPNSVLGLFGKLFADLDPAHRTVNFASVNNSGLSANEHELLRVDARNLSSRRIRDLYRAYWTRLTGEVDSRPAAPRETAQSLVPEESGTIGYYVRQEIQGALESFGRGVTLFAPSGYDRAFAELLGRLHLRPNYGQALAEYQRIAWTADDFKLISTNHRDANQRLRRAWRLLQVLVEPKGVAKPLDVKGVRHTRRLLAEALREER